ncbi:MAG: type II toxin-antitoxin system prevent-host-death family antitoxin [Candidatus Limnocylindria bacterium]
MIRVVNVHEAKTNLSKLLQDVERGEEILIGRAGEPIARLSPYQAEKREIGFASGQIWIADDFDVTPEQIIRDFEG